MGIRFNDARGAASTLQMMPPFAFSDVTMTVLPLQANLSRLTDFCDAYLNNAPDRVQFRPFLPFVYLVILDYGKMAARAANTGWVSQREVAFGIPMRWMTPTGEIDPTTGEPGLTFHDFAFTTPFIFVDNELSMSTGREVYGWPKLLGRLDPSVSRWQQDPNGARRVFEISSRAVGRTGAGDPHSPVLSVTQESLAALSDLPTRADGLAAALATAPETMAGLSRAWGGMARLLGGFAADGLAGAAGGSTREMLERLVAAMRAGRPASPETWSRGLGGLLRGVFPKVYANTINLKQFRDAQTSSAPCYQAVTAARMPVQSVRRGGLLGAEHLAVGRIDGGYRVHVHHSSAMPLVSALGLEAVQSSAGPAGASTMLTPVFPFWLKLDMVYGAGDPLVWRMRSGGWRSIPGMAGVRDPDPAEAAPKGPARSRGAEAAPAETEALDRLFDLTQSGNLFNTSRGGTEALAGRFRMPGAQLRVLPLKADPGTLGRFVADYLDAKGRLRFEPWGDFVYLIVANVPQRIPESDAAQSHACRIVSFSVPVKVYDAPEDGSGPCGDDRGLIGVALTTPFSYADDARVAIARNEVAGIPTLRSEIASPSHGWAGDVFAGDVLLETRSLVLPTVGSGGKGAQESLIVIRRGPVFDAGDDEAWREIAPRWGRVLADDLERKLIERAGIAAKRAAEIGTLGALDAFRVMQLGAVRLLAGEAGVDTISLKQFRDSRIASDACYQALVRNRTRIARLERLAEIEEDLTVSIARFPTQPIAEILGLEIKATMATANGLVDHFEPLRPFEMTADLIEEEGRTLVERAEDDDWTPSAPYDGPLGWRPATAKEVEEAAERTPAPSLRYELADVAGGGAMRFRRRVLDAATLRKFRHDAGRDGLALRDVMLLDRRREVPFAVSWKQLDKLDGRGIPDLPAFCRALGEAGKLEPLAAVDVAAKLEQVAPATVIDALLSRRWGPGPDAPLSCDGHLRVGSLGDRFAAELFPPAERQGGCWPAHDDYGDVVHRQRVGTLSAFRFEFWREVARLGRLEWALAEAKRTLPAFFLTEFGDAGSDAERLRRMLALPDAAELSGSFEKIEGYATWLAENIFDPKVFEVGDDDGAARKAQAADMISVVGLNGVVDAWREPYSALIEQAKAVDHDDLRGVSRATARDAGRILRVRLRDSALPKDA